MEMGWYLVVINVIIVVIVTLCGLFGYIGCCGCLMVVLFCSVIPCMLLLFFPLLLGRGVLLR